MVKTHSRLCVQYRVVVNSVYHIRRNLKIRHTEARTEDASHNPPPNICSGHFQHLLSRSVQVHCLASVLLTSQLFRGNYVIDQWRTQECCSGWGVQQIQLRTEGIENGDLGAVAP
jgi:hypothetical protein